MLVNKFYDKIQLDSDPIHLSYRNVRKIGIGYKYDMQLALWSIMPQKYDTILIWLCMFSMIPYRDSAITSPVSRSFNFFHEHDYLSVTSSFIAAVPYNHIEVLYHVKTRTNGPCLHASFVRVESAMFDRAWIRARFSRVRCLHARVGILILHPHDSRLGLFNLTSFS